MLTRSTILVLDPPAAVVTAGEAIAARVFPADDDPEFVQTLLYAAQMQIDGPKGWLGKSIGSQMLEYRADEFCQRIELPYPPVTNVLSVAYLDSDGATVEIAAADYRIFGSEGNLIERVGASAWPTVTGSDAARVQYEAGYEADDPVLGLIKHAIMLMARDLRGEGIDLGSVRSETVEGIGRFDYQVPQDAVGQMRTTAEKLLGPLWAPVV